MPAGDRFGIERPIFIVGPPRSGSGLLHGMLGRIPGVDPVGTENHDLFDVVAPVLPSVPESSSDRLDASDATLESIGRLERRLLDRVRGSDGVDHSRESVRILDKTPKNALRVPFLSTAFPDASFVYLYRDPRESISSMIDGWRSGRFVTHPSLDGWVGLPWSFLLVPGWRELRGRTLGDIVSRQWATTVDVLLDDLEALPPERWCVASYDRLLVDTESEMGRICAFLELEWNADQAPSSFPIGRRGESPNPERWQTNTPEVLGSVDIFGSTAERARALFASAPRIEVVSTATRSSRIASAGAGRNPVGDGPAFDARRLAVRYSRGMFDLLDGIGSTLVLTSRSADRIILIRPVDGGLEAHHRSLPSPMGVAFNGRELAVGLRGEIVIFQNQPELTERLDRRRTHDGCFVPRRRHYTGDVGAQDLAWGSDGLWMANSRFSCLATLDETHSFVPRWAPGFISKLVAEDRCHLNGLALVGESPRYATVRAMTDTPYGWRAQESDGGAILEVPSGVPICTGLASPHSPRWHDGRLWVLESSVGALMVVDTETGEKHEVARVPGFARGLTFVGQYALVATSMAEEPFLGDPPEFGSAGRRELECGIWALDTETGTTIGTLRFDSGLREISDLEVLPGLRVPELLEPGSSLAETAFVLPEPGSAPILD